MFSLNESGAVYRGESPALSREELRTFMQSVLRSRFRKRGYIPRFLQQLDMFGQAELTWSFVRRIGPRDDHWVAVHAWTDASGVHLQCTGPQAESVIDRANSRGEGPGSRTRRKKRRASFRSRRARRVLRNEARRALLRVQDTPRLAKQRKKFIPAPLSLVRNEQLTPQFRKSRVTWSEALTAVTEIFGVRGNGKYTARQLVAREMWDSLERSGFRFAQYRRRGFCMRIDLVDGIWRGEITPLTVSCTKDNSHRTYRRMREYLSGLVQGLSKRESKQRRMMLMRRGILKAA